MISNLSCHCRQTASTSLTNQLSHAQLHNSPYCLSVCLFGFSINLFVYLDVHSDLFLANLLFCILTRCIIYNGLSWGLPSRLYLILCFTSIITFSDFVFPYFSGLSGQRLFYSTNVISPLCFVNVRVPYITADSRPILIIMIFLFNNFIFLSFMAFCSDHVFATLLLSSC